MTVARTRIAPRPHDPNAEAESRLVAERVAAAGRAESLRRDVEAIVESAKGGATDDEHDVEGATVAFERAQAMALLDETRAQIETLDLALARVAAGTYGRCESCGDPIAPERLAARPAATTCIRCASRRR
jgi:RNA polymerase-binding transcription factor